MKGSYEETQKTILDSGLVESFFFHYPAYWEPELNAHLQVTYLLLKNSSSDLPLAYI